MGLLVTWLVLSAGIWGISRFLSGFEVRSPTGALITGAIFGVLHWGIGKLLYVVLVVATLGLGHLLAFLTRLVVTAIVLKVTDSLLDSLSIKNFRTAFLAAILLSLVSLLRDLLPI